MDAIVISEILYRHDPANTGCNVCEDMEDEYDRIAAEIARIPERPLTFDAFRAVVVDAFFEDALSQDALQQSFRDISALAQLQTQVPCLPDTQSRGSDD
ncbi:MAG: hypothetical protein C0607_22350 [Azoarcus sp.]|nr:MAG: hypothetical protein C0607_22350 [Azoarcus sp.]